MWHSVWKLGSSVTYRIKPMVIGPTIRSSRMAQACPQPLKPLSPTPSGSVCSRPWCTTSVSALNPALASVYRSPLLLCFLCSGMAACSALPPQGSLTLICTSAWESWPHHSCRLPLLPFLNERYARLTELIHRMKCLLSSAMSDVSVPNLCSISGTQYVLNGFFFVVVVKLLLYSHLDSKKK